MVISNNALRTIINEESTNKHLRTVSVAGGMLLLNPQLNSCHGLLEVFLLSKIVWCLLAELDVDEKAKLLERETEFAKSKLGYFFSNKDTNSPATNSEIVQGIINWTEKEVKGTISVLAFQRLQQTIAEMKKSMKTMGLADHRVHDLITRSHRLQKATEEKASKVQPSDALFGLKNNVAFVGAVKNQAEPRLSPMSPRRQMVASSTANQNPISSVVLGEKRSLEEMREELKETHNFDVNKKRCIQKNDVVSGKGEKAKQQNQMYLQMIRDNAVAYKEMDNLESKRKMACSIALRVVEMGGCFVGSKGYPLSPEKAFKRVITSLKDCRCRKATKIPTVVASKTSCTSNQVATATTALNTTEPDPLKENSVFGANPDEASAKVALLPAAEYNKDTFFDNEPVQSKHENANETALSEDNFHFDFSEADPISLSADQNCDFSEADLSDYPISLSADLNWDN